MSEVEVMVGLTLREVKEEFLRLVDRWKVFQEGYDKKSCNSGSQTERNIARAHRDRLKSCSEEVEDLLAHLMKRSGGKE